MGGREKQAQKQAKRGCTSHSGFKKAPCPEQKGAQEKVVGEEAGEVGMSQARISFVCRAKEAEVHSTGNGEPAGSEKLKNMIVF